METLPNGTRRSGKPVDVSSSEDAHGWRWCRTTEFKGFGRFLPLFYLNNHWKWMKTVCSEERAAGRFFLRGGGGGLRSCLVTWVEGLWTRTRYFPVMSMRGVPAAILFVASLPFPTEIVIFRLLECIFFRPEKWRLMNSALVRVVASFAWRTTALPFRKWKKYSSLQPSYLKFTDLGVHPDSGFRRSFKKNGHSGR